MGKMLGMKIGTAEHRKMALYNVWLDMIKKARREQELKLMHGLTEDVRPPISKAFLNYEIFLLWAIGQKRYKPGVDDRLRLIRIDKRKDWKPSNCDFVDGLTEDELDEIEWEHTDGARVFTHCSSASRLYEIWRGMVRRCTKQNCKDYRNYGGRGIKVCPEWSYSFNAFVEWAWEHGYSPDLSLDRIDVNGNYCPDNCRWATDIEQMLNKRSTEKKYINLRYKAKKMREIIANLPDDAILTLVVNRKYIQNVALPQSQDDFEPVPKEERIDKLRGSKF